MIAGSFSPAIVGSFSSTHSLLRTSLALSSPQMPSQSTTPLRLVHLTVLGSALLAICFILDLLPLPRLGTHARLFAGGAAVLFLLAAFTLTMVNQQRLAFGVKKDVWNEDELSEARAWIDQRWLTTWQMSLLFAGLVFAFIRILFHWHGVSGFIFLVLAGESISSLKATLRKPQPNKPGPAMDWTTTRPIHSDQWGHPTH